MNKIQRQIVVRSPGTNLRKSDSEDNPCPCSAQSSLLVAITSATRVEGASAESASKERSLALNFTLHRKTQVKIIKKVNRMHACHEQNNADNISLT